jgi:hypothetical protein
MLNAVECCWILPQYNETNISDMTQKSSYSKPTMTRHITEIHIVYILKNVEGMLTIRNLQAIRCCINTSYDGCRPSVRT